MPWGSKFGLMLKDAGKSPLTVGGILFKILAG